MSKRFSYQAAGYEAVYALHRYVQECGLDLGLLELIRLRISQINGCAYCINMHAPLARQHGLADSKIHLAAAWKDADVFSERELAALAWAEAVTRLSDAEVADAVYQRAQAQFSDSELSDLTLAVVEMNAWNRLMIASKTPPDIG